MEKELFITNDGSHSILVPKHNLSYHSKHGAIAESMHVFLAAGFDYIIKNESSPSITIFEMGFGTGLNALLTIMKAEALKQRIEYITIETDPLDSYTIKNLNYCQQLQRPDLQAVFETMHNCAWNQNQSIIHNFQFKKIKASLLEGIPAQKINLVYFDAFAPDAQPELWTESNFHNIFQQMEPNGILVTYCSKSIVRKAMMAAGFTVIKIPGPHGKREMVRAISIK
jgi:tRNA U34 5-methylaminomethyl-2-thiouridine-forming methyltransferase MnmC